MVAPKVMARLSQPGAIEILVARVAALNSSQDIYRGRVRPYIRVVTDSISLDAKAVIDARGFDPWSFVKLLRKPLLPSSAVGRRKAEARITYDLQFDSRSCSGLHVPSLAGVSQGPGLANLNMLGEMARRILSRYLGAASTQKKP